MIIAGRYVSTLMTILRTASHIIFRYIIVPPYPSPNTKKSPLKNACWNRDAGCTISLSLEVSFSTKSDNERIILCLYTNSFLRRDLGYNIIQDFSEVPYLSTVI